MVDISRSLRRDDFVAVTRALDRNGNGQIDASEATLSSKAHRTIGNGNGVAGTRETAEALERGDVFISRLSPEASEAVGRYFSQRAQNAGRPTSQWLDDAWISKDDLDLDPEARRALDLNRDDRLSRKEFAEGLSSGAITIGRLSDSDRPVPPGSDRPLPPGSGPIPPSSGRPTPPSSDRPTPPSGSDRPTPPSTGPVPPPIDRPYPPSFPDLRPVAEMGLRSMPRTPILTQDFEAGWKTGKATLRTIDDATGGRHMATRMSLAAIEAASTHQSAYSAAKAGLTAISLGQDATERDLGRLGLSMLPQSPILTQDFEAGWKVGLAAIKALETGHHDPNVRMLATAARRSIEASKTHQGSFQAARGFFQQLQDFQPTSRLDLRPIAQMALRSMPQSPILTQDFETGWKTGKEALVTMDEAAGGRDMATRMALAAIEVAPTHQSAYTAAKNSLTAISLGQDATERDLGRLGLSMLPQSPILTQDFEAGWKVGLAAIKALETGHYNPTVRMLAASARASIEANRSHQGAFDVARGFFRQLQELR